MVEETDFFFVIGSPRSGTKILRDTIGSHPDVKTTDSPLEDVWTYGQADTDHDSYKAEQLTSQIKRNIRNEFNQKSSGASMFVEKNVRHSLRIPYVRSVFPRAKFIHIVRHPLDVVVSLEERWRNPIDWDYYLSTRAFEIPLADIIHYTAQLGWDYVKRILSLSDHVDTWGPHYPGLLQDLEDRNLLEVCALQWKHCVTGAREEGMKFDDDYYQLCYEQLMHQPSKTLDALGDFMCVGEIENWLSFAQHHYRTNSINRYDRDLTPNERDRVTSILGSLPEALGYELS
ncbi:MAG: sulfotransferase [bacterium]